MISSIHTDKKATHESLNCHVANAFVRADGHSVPIRILNVLDKPIELCQGRKIAEFTPLVHSSSKQSSACCSVAPQTSYEFRERAAEMIDSSFGKEDADELLDVLSAYQDVFEYTLGHTNVVKPRLIQLIISLFDIARAVYRTLTRRSRTPDTQNVKSGHKIRIHQKVHLYQKTSHANLHCAELDRARFQIPKQVFSLICLVLS